MRFWDVGARVKTDRTEREPEPDQQGLGTAPHATKGSAGRDVGGELLRRTGWHRPSRRQSPPQLRAVGWQCERQAGRAARWRHSVTGRSSMKKSAGRAGRRWSSWLSRASAPREISSLFWLLLWPWLPLEPGVAPHPDLPVSARERGASGDGWGPFYFPGRWGWCRSGILITGPGGASKPRCPALRRWKGAIPAPVYRQSPEP